jgi:hypothetical protein
MCEILQAVSQNLKLPAKTPCLSPLCVSAPMNVKGFLPEVDLLLNTV